MKPTPRIIQETIYNKEQLLLELFPLLADVVWRIKEGGPASCSLRMNGHWAVIGLTYDELIIQSAVATDHFFCILDARTSCPDISSAIHKLYQHVLDQKTDDFVVKFFAETGETKDGVL